MSGVRVLVGTRKGAFVLTSDGKRKEWKVEGPHFGGLEIYHLKGSPADPNRIYASQATAWFGQVVHRSDDGGTSWETVGNDFRYQGDVGYPSVVRRHRPPVGVQAGVAFRAVPHRPGRGLRRRRRCRALPDHRRRPDRGRNSPDCAGHASGSQWAPGAGGMCLHTILLDPSNPGRIFIAISAAGVFRSDDAGHSLEAHEPRPALRVHAGAGSRGRPLRPPDRPAPVPAVNAVHAEALGRDAQRRQRRVVAARSAATCPRISVSWSTSTPTNPRRSMWCRSRATRNITRPRADCASIAAGPAGTSGKRSAGACPSRTATSTSCATRCRSTRSNRRGCTSERPAARCTPRPTPATAGPAIVRDLPAVLSVEVQTLP